VSPSAAAAPAPRHEWALALGVAALALLVRLAHGQALADTAFPLFPVVFTESDMHAFLVWATRILEGDWLGRNTYHVYTEWMKSIAPLETWHRWWGGREIFHQAPLYPYALALALGASGRSLDAVLRLQLVVGTLQAVVIYALARRLFDVRTAVVAGTLAALYGPLLFYQGVLLRDWLPPLLEPLALVLLLLAARSGRAIHGVLAGTALGLATLSKETALLLLPVTLVWLALEHRRAWRRAVGSAAAVVGGFALCLAPVVARNVAVGAPPLAISGSGPGSFILGHAADAQPVGFSVPPSLKPIMEHADGRTLVAIRETLATHRDWTSLVHLELRKLRGVVDPHEVADNASYDYGVEISPVLRFTLGFGILFPLGAAGLAVFARRRRALSLLLAYSACALLGLVYSVVHARYRLALVPPLLVLGAAFLVWMFDQLRARHLRTAALGVGLVALLALTQHALALVPRSDYARPQEYFMAAAIYEGRRQWDRAAAEMERLATHAASHRGLTGSLATFEALQRHYTGLGLLDAAQSAEAEQELLRAVATDPRLPGPHFALGVMYMTERPDAVKARRHLERFLELAPRSPQAERARQLLVPAS
jgi:4-amino-4-deoxy-L-arabinose transferase-like glycosyltransferase